MADELYEKNYRNAGYFSFGKNWQNFLSRLHEDQIQEAMLSLEAFLGGKENISGKTFVDIGCGSGLFSLAAYRLGAQKILSVDIDESSVWCVHHLHEKEGRPENWKVLTGSALDQDFLKKLGTFDIVYSWGVLHHTGNMEKALQNIARLPNKGGRVFIAIYNDNKRILEGTSRFWLKMKKIYNHAPQGLQKIMEVIYADYIALGLLLHGINPLSYVRSYRSLRGMDFWTDIRDWLGGYPYEYASQEEITDFFEKQGFVLIRTIAARSIGCNEFLFESSPLEESSTVPLVSVVVPVYNSAETLDKCVESIFQQTYPSLSAIFINDASTDESLPKLLAWQEKIGADKVIIISNESNLGVTQSLNKGLQIAQGKYIARIDADDWWTEEKIEKQVKFLETHSQYRIVGCNYININGTLQRKIRMDTDDALIRKNIIRHNPFAHSCVVYSTELIQQIGGYDEKVKYGSDYDLFLRMLPYSKFYNIPEFLCYRTIQAEGISIKKQKEQMLQGVRSKIKYIREYKLSPLNYFHLWELLLVAYTPRIIRNFKRKVLG